MHEHTWQPPFEFCCWHRLAPFTSPSYKIVWIQLNRQFTIKIFDKTDHILVCIFLICALCKNKSVDNVLIEFLSSQSLLGAYTCMLSYFPMLISSQCIHWYLCIMFLLCCDFPLSLLTFNHRFLYYKLCLLSVINCSLESKYSYFACGYASTGQPRYNVHQCITKSFDLAPTVFIG